MLVANTCDQYPTDQNTRERRGANLHDAVGSGRPGGACLCVLFLQHLIPLLQLPELLHPLHVLQLAHELLHLPLHILLIGVRRCCRCDRRRGGRGRCRPVVERFAWLVVARCPCVRGKQEKRQWGTAPRRASVV